MASLFADSLTKKIPDGWISTQLGRCLDLVRNGLSFEQNQEGRGVRVTRIETISEGTINTEKVGFVETDGDISKYLLKRGDVLFSHINSIKHIGKVAQFDNDEELYHGMNLLVLQFNSKVDKRFGYYFLASPQTKSICERMAKQAVNQASINTKEIRQLPIALPPLPEQRKIAEILSTVDEAIEKTNAIIQETRQLKKELMQKLFTEGIGHTRFKETKVGRIPEEWEVVNLSNVFQVIDGDRGVNYPKSNEMFDDGYCVFLNAKNVTKSGFKFNEVQFITLEKDEILGKGKLTRGDLVLTTRGTLGNFAYFNDEVTFENLRINSGMVVLRPLNNILTNYYYKYFNSYLMQNQIERLSFGTAQSQLTVGGIQKFRLLVPPNDEQRQIAQILSQVDSKIQTEQAFKEELEQLKKGLMQVLLTGKVRVKV